MKKTAIGIFLIGLMVFLAACGSNDSGGNSGAGQTAAPPTVQPTATPAQSTPAGQAEQEAETAADFPRDIDSAYGTVTVEQKPLRVAAANWMLLELLLTFDVPQAGISLPFAAANSSLGTDVYKAYADRFEEIQIVGENVQVNLEAMLAFEPDVIIAGSKINQEIRPQLEQIATTAWYDEEKINLRADWTELLAYMGTVLGQEEHAEAVINDFRTKQSEGKQQLASRSDETVMFVQVREKAVYVMTAASIPQYYAGLGLTPPDAVAKMESISQVTLEGLAEINPDHLFLGFFNWTDKSLPALTDEWQESEVWKSLKAVKNNQVYPFNGELALGIGPIGQAYGVDTVVEAMK